ncbi:MAG: hypothetical protein V2I43_07320 [Parvularcula sp.]|jgi:hypothetical protein|nr:hypothetical protein [Parvularcula sp.]
MLRHALLGVPALLAPLLITPAFAEDPFAGMTAIEDEVLAEHRGRYSVGGFDLEFGLTIAAGGELITQLFTAPQTLHAARLAAGQSASVASLSFDHDGGLRVIENARDNVVLQHDLVIDILVRDTSPMLSSPTSALIRSAAPPSLFGTM